MTRLPVEDAIPDLIAALKRDRLGVLQAPPGAGKTTRVPLAMREAGVCEGRIIMLEPRRLATRAAATRMAQTLGEPVGQTVGFRIRGEAKTSQTTRIEVVTEGILTRMIQSDPELGGVGAVIFDEFHERSLNADLGLALALEVRDTLRPDLILLAMSATLDAAPVADLMRAQVITSAGQSFPITTHWLDKPLGPKVRWESAMADLIRHALTESKGGVLAFLPGEGEIRRVAKALGEVPGTVVLPLYGALAFKAQQAALSPVEGRKLVLATAIAETSLTIPDISVVVDGGRARRAQFDPGSGMSRLVTDRVTRAEADQRRGRAGRVASGTCYRLWTKGEDGALAAFPPAEIEAADLTALALELAEWGSDSLQFLTPPPTAALNEARALLVNLGALDANCHITPHGRALAKMPLHPRLAHMLTRSGKSAAPLAALMADRDPLRGAGVDLATRLAALKDGRRDPGLARIRDEAKRLERRAPPSAITDPAAQAALAYPDRIALRRAGDDPRWLLSGGKGVKMDPSDALAGQRLLVVTDTDGHPTEARVRMALAISEGILRDVLGANIETVTFAEWSKRDGRVLALIEERLGAVALSSKRWDEVADDVLATAMLEGIRQLGISHSKAARLFRARVKLVKAAGHNLPDLSDETLMNTLEEWLLPHLGKTRSQAEWKAFKTLPALRAMLDWTQTQTLDREAPARFETPLGRHIDIDYGGTDPEISVRLQEMFGTTRHPMVAGRPLRVTLLSPAHKPLQTTMDIPGFWSSSYSDVRKDMRGRYPKHSWPEDPTAADPTLRPKRRK